ncbi:MAG TPA: polyphosphate kinase 1 [Gemmatimonadales bacterium]|nr:polyphosphate kinase 1 [Gemmatimonadales bacterium]
MTDLHLAVETGSDVDLHHPSLYLNRELSWLEFNRRVLHEAEAARTPLLERLKFAAIFSSNLDEFFQVRVAGLRRQCAAGVSERTADGMKPEEQLRAIAVLVDELTRRHQRVLMEEIVPSLAAHGVELVTDVGELAIAEREHLARYFRENVFPVLTPLAVDPGHPFPYISNLSLSLAVVLRGQDGEDRFARVKVPKILPRWVPLDTPGRFVPLELLIAANLDALFPGIEILGSYLFRITRNTEMELDHDDAEDLLLQIQEEVRNRRFGEVVRVEIQSSMPSTLRQLLLAEFNDEQEQPAMPLTAEDVYETGGLLDTADLLSLSTLEIPDLRDLPFHAVTPHQLTPGRSFFEVLQEGDLLVHHPYDNFATSVEAFIAEAANDPDVVAIKLTLYRTGGDSSIARLLAHAAERGKQVACLIELQARFDEENNIRWAQRLEDVGVHVSYGVTGLKTHAKVMLVVRREGGAMRRYVHIGTGNYNPKTARIYTDFGLFSTDPDLSADLTDLFNVLTGFGTPAGYRKLIVAPRGMRQRFLELIQREIEHARAGRDARILAKMNSLVDPDIIAALYSASRAGVEIDLVVRGICCLRPGLPGVSDRIRVISVVGRFLEHSRAFCFANGGALEVYFGSADWMPRNLDRRIEAVAPLEDATHRQAVMQSIELMWRDNQQAWDLRGDGSYVRRTAAPGEPPMTAQTALMEMARASGATTAQAVRE